MSCSFLTSKWSFQDVGAFSEDSFDVKEWINRTFKSAEAQENKDVSRTGHHPRLRRVLVPDARVALVVARRPSAAELAAAFPLSSAAPLLRDADRLFSETIRLFFRNTAERFLAPGGRNFRRARVSHAEIHAGTSVGSCTDRQ